MKGKIVITVYRETAKGKGRIVSSVALTSEEYEAIQLLKQQGIQLGDIMRKGLAAYGTLQVAEEQQAILPPDYPLTETEVEKIAQCMADSIVNDWDWKWDEHKEQEKQAMESEYNLICTHQHPEYFGNASACQYEKVLPDDLLEKLETYENVAGFFKPLNLKAEKIMEKRFEKEFLTPLAGEWTLKAICDILATVNKPFTVQEIATILRLPYSVVYNKVVPLLQEYFSIKG